MTVASKCRVDVPAGYKCMIAALVPEIFGTFAPSHSAVSLRRPTYEPTSRNTHKSQDAIKLREVEERRKKILEAI